ncbi:MAG: hypothetical protein CMI16_01510 [Opitutaceae bacterium]|nr:hypothetical protein [Opitutaceae bacterium]
MSAYRINTFTTPAIKRRSLDHPPEVRDFAWGRPLFQAPKLPNPSVIFDPLPFTVHRPAGMRSDTRVD